MTAEIALLNRSALALAADSAVTLRIGSTYKTYNTAEKIFEFSCHQPIALMIYNNVEFVGVPFDVLIRKHREECNHSHDRMEDAARHFLEYLLKFDRRVGEDKLYLAALLVDVFTDIRADFRKVYNRLISGDESVGGYAAELVKLLEKYEKKYAERPLEGFLSDKDQQQFDQEYGEASDQAFNTIFVAASQSEDKSVYPAMRKLAFSVVKSRLPSEIFTGLVFGGFAAKDLFPTLHHLEIDGVFFNRIKIISRGEVDIDRGGDHAQIVPFAQKDMAERFIYGIDEEFEGSIAYLVQELFSKIVEMKSEAFASSEKQKIRELVAESVIRTLHELRGAERQSILDIVNFMSKKELAEMAAALVEVTSAKRRFSIQQETVGGPIDVAVVSRSEGFVWIRRKHYFDREANPGYFTRVFPRNRGNHNGSSRSA